MYKLRNEKGDTIVEVMVALTVLALAFSIAFSTANKSLLTVRNAQEHSEALQYLSSQIELARSDSGDDNLYRSGRKFCMDPSSGAATPVIIRMPNARCTIGPLNYSVTIDYSTPAEDIFTFEVTWPGVSDFGVQREQIFYKLHKL